MATSSKITCPDCHKVLRPAKPLPAGKKVKCPQCGGTFVTPGAEPDPDAITRQPKAAARGAGRDDGDNAKKKKAESRPAATGTGDDEEVGIYGFLDDGGHGDEDDGKAAGKGGRGERKKKEKEKEKEKPDINYAPDMSIKDLRGPAQERIMRPTNFLLMDGVIGFIGYLAVLIVILIPALTPLEDSTGKPRDAAKIGPGFGQASAGGMGMPRMPQMGGQGQQDQGPKKINVLKKEQRSFFEIAGVDLAGLARYPWYFFLVALLPVFFGLIYCGILTYGAVKAQSLESRGWGLASSIMALFPISVSGVVTTIGLVFQVIYLTIFDDDGTVEYILGVMSGVLALLSIAAGVYGLMILKEQKVIDGFEYQPE